MQYLQVTAFVIMSFLMIGCQTNSKTQKSQATMKLNNAADTTVAVCNMTEKEQMKRSERLREELFAEVEEVRELEDGYALQLPASNEMMQKISEHVWIESQCCPFFEFEITVKPDNGPIWLNFKGGEKVKELIGQDMEKLKKAVSSG
jgi:hypothetical protein